VNPVVCHNGLCGPWITPTPGLPPEMAAAEMQGARDAIDAWNHAHPFKRASRAFWRGVWRTLTETGLLWR
jgi:hypothetical protein